PLAAGTVGLPAALAFFALQGGVGLLILLYLPTTAQITALLAIPLILAYPLMKRIIWAPQAWLGVTFNWGALVGFAAAEGELRAPAFLLWAGCAAWTFGYDTIYAHQDKEDDALVGVKSTARWFGTASRAAVAASYAVSAGLFALAYLIARPGDLIGAAAIIAIFGGLLWRQTERARFDDPDDCLAAFKSNVRAGLAMAAVMATAPMLAGALPL
ncbi:MAG: UbiA family prenyltransferase, partial [Caulobacterales bacterium]|nr:UbiA family prenyltransferase [Caulobacterales bacterium]